MKYKRALLVAASVGTFAMGLVVEPDVSRWSVSGGPIKSAKAQGSPPGCPQSPIAGTTVGGSLYDCPDGYYRWMGGDYVAVDRYGRAVAEATSETPGPEPANQVYQIEVTPLELAEPRFRAVPR